MIYRNLLKLLRREGSKDGGYVVVPEAIFRRLLAASLKQKGEFDERFYLENYGDIAVAVKSRSISSALDHYLETGYFENRLPKRFIVDEAYYLQENPDVAEAIRRGTLSTAQEHFDNAGFAEGRLPYKNFSLF
jgi:hypothetical protein